MVDVVWLHRLSEFLCVDHSRGGGIGFGRDCFRVWILEFVEASVIFFLFPSLLGAEVSRLENRSRCSLAASCFLIIFGR